ncbi:hypothetical protein JXA56_03575 [Candidatus Micrarchaeota archaeon]|nr:hypothetical protein [Candidatus Micrarchaeota archaeon]
MIEESINDSAKLLEKNWKKLAIDFSKIYGLIYLILIISTIIMVGSWLMVSTGIMGNIWIGIAVAVAATIVLQIIMIVLTGVIRATAYLVVSERAAGKSIGIIREAGKLLFPVARYTLVIIAIQIAILAVIIAPILLLSGSASVILMTIFAVACIIAFVVFLFIIQFGLLEVIYSKTGVIASLKASINKVKKNVVPVFIFDLILLVIVLALSIPFAILMQFLILPVMMMGAAFGQNLAFGIIGMILYFALIFIMSVAMEMGMLPLQYFFWKRLM